MKLYQTKNFQSIFFVTINEWRKYKEKKIENNKLGHVKSQRLKFKNFNIDKKKNYISMHLFKLFTIE